ncbi:hypothetical protein EBU91_03550 [bacterium]|nr:hypothetical protein [bacterium]
MKRIVRLTERDLTRIVKRVISETNWFNQIIFAHPSKKDISDAMNEVKNSTDESIKKVIVHLYNSYMNNSGAKITYKEHEVTLSKEEVKEDFYEIVKAIRDYGIEGIKIGTSSNNRILVSSEQKEKEKEKEKKHRWGDHMYDDYDDKGI